MTDQQGFGHRLRQARQQAGLTQQELADACGLHKQHVSKLERGALVRIGPKAMDRLTEVLGVTEPWLRYGIVTAETTALHGEAITAYLATTIGSDTPPDVAAKLYALDWSQVGVTRPNEKDVHRMREMVELNLRLRRNR